MSSFEKKFDHLKLPLKDILIATNNFAEENIVRRDGFGNEYKGLLLLTSGNRIHILARRLDTTIGGHGSEEFHNEIMVLAGLKKHQNLISIIGFCEENDEKVIINTFEAKLSLEQYLSKPLTLDWTRRMKICLGIARAISHIHYDERFDFSVIHRDVKSSKILLDDDWEAKLSGFELCTKQPAARRHDLLHDLPCGSRGYVDPAYHRSERVGHKSDVYSFGVILFEVLSGRKAFIPDSKGVLLAELARSHYENGRLGDIIHPDLQKQMDSQALKAFSEAAYSCLNHQYSQRPNINQLIFALDQALELQLAYERSYKNLEHLKIGLDAVKFATDNFSTKFLIVRRGYGDVYKTEIEHFDSFAMKGNMASELPRRRSTAIIRHMFNRDKREATFFAEIEPLTKCIHPNIVSLLGFCYEYPHMILVHEHVSNGNLENYLKRKEKMDNLTWGQRIKICIDIARGLDYLHTTTDRKPKPIVHGDITSANILLNENLTAKISNHGTNKFYPHKQTSSAFRPSAIGTPNPYHDPKYWQKGMRKKESDVYSFGVVLFEIVTGRTAYSFYSKSNEKGLVPIVRQHFKRKTMKELVDPKLKEERDEQNFSPNSGLNEDSLYTFCKIGYQCLATVEAKHPSMKEVINELYKALYLQEFPKSLQISFEDIKMATKGFNVTNLTGIGGFGRAYRGDILVGDESTHIVAKRNDTGLGQGEDEFLTEIEILFKYKHENIISLEGYCRKKNERILVYEYASNGSLDRHLKLASLTWTKRIEICIDVARGLEFLHGVSSTQAPVIHRDLKSTNILLNDNWKAKIGDFGLSLITPEQNEFDVMTHTACGTYGYIDPLYLKHGLLSRESDIYSLGVVFLEMMCGRFQDPRKNLVDLVKHHYKEEKVDEMVFEGIKDTINPISLIAFVKIACECVDDERQKRPTASKVVLELKKVFELQLDG